MRLESLLERLPGLNLERPPEVWEATADEARVAALVNATLERVFASIAPTLRVLNVVVEPPDDDDEMIPPPGEYLSLTLLAPVNIGPDATWHPTIETVAGVLGDLQAGLVEADVRFAYVRWLPPNGSVTFFLAKGRS